MLKFNPLIFLMVSINLSSLSAPQNEILIHTTPETYILEDILPQVEAKLKMYDISVRLVATREEAMIDLNDETVHDSLYINLRDKLRIDLPYSPILRESYGNSIEFVPQNASSDAEYNRVVVNYLVGLALYAHNQCTVAETYFAATKSTSLISARLSRTLSFFEGVCALQANDYETARMQFEAAYYDGDRPLVNNSGINLSWIYLHEGDSVRAFALMDEMIERWANIDGAPLSFKIEPLIVRAQLYTLDFDFPAALSDIDTALDLITASGDDIAVTDPQLISSLYVQRGQIYLLLYQWDDVLADYNRALQIDPTCADAYFYRGVLYYTVVVDRDKALPDFVRYLELAPDGIHAAEAAQYQADIQGQLDALNN